MPTTPFGNRTTSVNPSSAQEQVRVYNASTTDTIPGNSCLEIVSYSQILNRYTVQKPTIDNRNDLLFSSPMPIPPETEGLAYRGYPALVSYMRYGIDPEPGQIWGSLKNKWALTPGATGFVVLDIGSGLENSGSALAPSRGVLLVQPMTYALIDWIEIQSSSPGTVQPDYYPGLITRFDPLSDSWKVTTKTVWWRDRYGRVPVAGHIIMSVHQGNAGTPTDQTTVRPLYVGDDGVSSSSNSTGAGSTGAGSTALGSASSGSDSGSTSGSGGDCCVRVLKDIEVAVNFDPLTCQATVTQTKTYTTICASLVNGQICLTGS